jgi:hypothetical protein
MSFVGHVPMLNFETIQKNYDNNNLAISPYLIVNIYNKNQQMMHLNLKHYIYKNISRNIPVISRTV